MGMGMIYPRLIAQLWIDFAVSFWGWPCSD